MSKRLGKERPIDLAKWSGPTRYYDLVKEITVAIVVVAVLALSLAALFSSPDERALTLQSWAKANPGKENVPAASHDEKCRESAQARNESVGTNRRSTRAVAPLTQL